MTLQYLLVIGLLISVCIGLGLKSVQKVNDVQSFPSNVVISPIYDTEFDPSCTSLLVDTISNSDLGSCSSVCRNRAKGADGFASCASISFDSNSNECKLWAYKSTIYRLPKLNVIVQDMSCVFPRCKPSPTSNTCSVTEAHVTEAQAFNIPLSTSPTKSPSSQPSTISPSKRPISYSPSRKPTKMPRR